MKGKLFILSAVLLLTCLFASAQNVSVSGTVVDENGQPIPGVFVTLHGSTSVGTTTLADGKFSLQVPSESMLDFIMLGYQPKSLRAERTPMRVQLVTDSQTLNEVVVTAMGMKRERKSIGYASQEVKADELLKTRQTGLNNALVGKISGARFVGGSGANFDAGSIVLRGTTSLYDNIGAEPIYVVDGVITNKNAVNMDDVESVNVLKGPAATSVYGSQGGNGAIIITTKSAKAGESSLSVTHTTMFERANIHAKLQKLYGGGYGYDNDEMPVYHFDPATDDPGLKALDGQRYYDYGDDASWGPRFDGRPYIPWYAWDKDDPRYGQTAPWEFGLDLNKFYRTGITNTTNVAFAKAGKGYNTRISFTNMNRTGVHENSDAVRRNINIKSSFDVTEKLSVSLDWKYTFQRLHNTQTEGYGDMGSFLQEFLQWGNTNVKPEDLKANYKPRPDGTFPTWNITDPTNLQPTFHMNPYTLMNYFNKHSDYQWNVFSANIDYKVIDGLSIGGNVYGNFRTYLYEYKMPEHFHNSVSEYYQSQSRIFDLQGQIYVKYARHFFGNRLLFNAAVFGEERDYRYESLSGGTSDGLLVDQFWNLEASMGKLKAENELTKYKTQSVFGTATFSFDDTYFLDMNVRNDWTSTLHPDYNSYLYGGLSASVLLNRFIDKPWLDFWKIRASMAQLGSTIGAYQIFPIVETGTRYGTTVTMSEQARMVNPSIKPTISTSWEAGTEFSLWRGRLYGDFNYYRKNSKNQIISQTVTGASGYTGRRINAGLIRNKGVEITLGGIPVSTRDFTWDVRFNISRNRNKLVELEDNGKDDDTYRIAWMGFNGKVYNFAEEGKPIGVVRGLDFMRDEQGRMVLTDKGNGIVSPKIRLSDDHTYFGIAQPDWTGGFSTGLRYKNLSLNASLDFSIGGVLVSNTNLWLMGSGLGDITAATNPRGGNVRDPLDKNGGVYLEGVDADGKPLSGYTDGRTYYETYIGGYTNWHEATYDASYVKLRELSLTYTLPSEVLKKTRTGLKGASLSLVAQNPWLIYSAVPNIDPSETVGAFYGFLETGQVVSTRTFGFTVSLVF
ncbi:MAG: SusC/RagA family TonB-linked outer membrane protein [Bacteroidales bacterium]|nr:SusC/RagA family TonB-linked outer membrane protein [Bacteroidales bacterium]MDY6002087.1 SusC/RagA family TonB-linked outer membrane protein [Candidatus Cryptobacteroides sp.]